VAVSGHPVGYAHHCDRRLAGRPLQNAAGVRSSLSHPVNEPSGADWGKSVCHFSCQSGLPAASTEAEAGRVEEGEGEGEPEAEALVPWPAVAQAATETSDRTAPARAALLAATRLCARRLRRYLNGPLTIPRTDARRSVAG
jgi:hypothetical protein